MLKMTYIFIMPFEYPMQVTPRVLSSDLLYMDPDVRKCLFRKEKGIAQQADRFLVFEREKEVTSQKKAIDILKDFSSTGCLYECMLQYAFHMCKCVPWNHPNFETIHTGIQHLGHLYDCTYI